jgi:hypothetical protein
MAARIARKDAVLRTCELIAGTPRPPPVGY